MYAGALFIGQALGWNVYTSIILLLIIASIFTITGLSRVHLCCALPLERIMIIHSVCHTGGLTAVMWTDFIQTCIMIVGAVGLMILGNNIYLNVKRFIT